MDLIKRLNKDFAATIALLFMALMSLDVLMKVNLIHDSEFFLLWLTLGTGLLVLYTVRFRRKPDVGAIDYLKLTLIMLSPSVPIIQFIISEFVVLTLFEFVGLIYFLLLITVYSFDRFIIKPPPMKKRFVIALIIESVIVLLSITYAFAQTVAAQNAMREALAARAESERGGLAARAQVEEIARELEKTRAQLDSLKSNPNP